VVAQLDQSDDQPAAPDRIRLRADDHGLIRLAIGMVPVTFLAIAFFGFNVYGLASRSRRSL